MRSETSFGIGTNHSRGNRALLQRRVSDPPRMDRPDSKRRPTPRTRRRGRAQLAILFECLAILALAALIVAWRMRAGARDGVLVRVSDHQVAVVTNLWTGEQRPVLTPGFEPVVPRLQAVDRFDKSAAQYVMEGEGRSGPNRVPRLKVRASDGSLFWFERVVVQYGLDLRRLPDVLRDSGPSAETRARLVDAFAPGVLLDELGRFDSKEVASPDNLQAASSRARVRLGALLAPHGLEVYEVALSKPSFDPRYEATIERREVALQEIQSLEQEASLMRKAQPSLLEEIEGKQKLELERSRANWTRELAELENEGERLEAGRPQELAQLEEYQRYALEKDRAQWSEELRKAREAADEIEGAHARKLERMDREHELALVERQAGWQRDGEALERQIEGLDALHAARVDALKRAKELEREAQRAESARELDATRAAAATASFEAKSYAAERVAAGRAARENGLGEAAEIEARARREQQSFLARAEAFQAQGPAAVRAALIERLSSIRFEIAPSAPPHASDPPAPRRAADRVASTRSEGGE